MKKTLLVLFLIFFLLSLSSKTIFSYNTDNPEALLARCLKNKGFVMYGVSECSACNIEKGYFGESFSIISYIDCDLNKTLCEQRKIHGFPTWIDGFGKTYKGAMTLDTLAQVSGCEFDKNAQLASPKTNFYSEKIKEILTAFLAGLFSFLAPCLLPLLPSYFSVITGFTFADLYGLNFENIRLRVFIASLFFSLGFGIVFTILGATGSIVGQLLDTFMPILLRLSGIVLVILGFMQLGIIKFEALQFDFAWKVQKRLTHLGYLTGTITGIAAALSWIPCIGPLLTPILILSAKSETVAWGSILLFTYSVGISLPFIVAGLFFPVIIKVLSSYRLLFHRLSQGAGFFLVIFGGILIFNKYRLFIDYFYKVLALFASR